MTGYFRRLPDRSVPFIYDRNKFIPGQFHCVDQRCGEGFICLKLGIYSQELFCYLTFDKGNNPFLAGLTHDIRNIKINHVKFIKICFIAFTMTLSYLEIFKQLGRITCPVIIRTQHLRRKRFAEPSGPADAGKSPGCIDGLIDQADQTAFVHIDIIPDSVKSLITGIKIGSHAFPPLHSYHYSAAAVPPSQSTSARRLKPHTQASSGRSPSPPTPGKSVLL